MIHLKTAVKIHSCGLLTLITTTLSKTTNLKNSHCCLLLIKDSSPLQFMAMKHLILTAMFLWKMKKKNGSWIQFTKRKRRNKENFYKKCKHLWGSIIYIILIQRVWIQYNPWTLIQNIIFSQKMEILLN